MSKKSFFARSVKVGVRHVVHGGLVGHAIVLDAVAEEEAEAHNEDEADANAGQKDPHKLGAPAVVVRRLELAGNLHHTGVTVARLGRGGLWVDDRRQ